MGNRGEYNKLEHLVILEKKYRNIVSIVQQAASDSYERLEKKWKFIIKNVERSSAEYPKTN